MKLIHYKFFYHFVVFINYLIKQHIKGCTICFIFKLFIEVLGFFVEDYSFYKTFFFLTDK